MFLHETVRHGKSLGGLKCMNFTRNENIQISEMYCNELCLGLKYRHVGQLQQQQPEDFKLIFAAKSARKLLTLLIKCLSVAVQAAHRTESVQCLVIKSSQSRTGVRDGNFYYFHHFHQISSPLWRALFLPATLSVTWPSCSPSTFLAVRQGELLRDAEHW